MRGRIKYATDSFYAKLWAERIGKLILNFAGLEFESLPWLVQMSEQVERIPEFAHTPFVSRVSMVTHFVDAKAFGESWKLASAEWLGRCDPTREAPEPARPQPAALRLGHSS